MVDTESFDDLRNPSHGTLTENCSHFDAGNAITTGTEGCNHRRKRSALNIHMTQHIFRIESPKWIARDGQKRKGYHNNAAATGKTLQVYRRFCRSLRQIFVKIVGVGIL